jgi:hypothetical protein
LSGQHRSLRHLRTRSAVQAGTGSERRNPSIRRKGPDGNHWSSAEVAQSTEGVQGASLGQNRRSWHEVSAITAGLRIVISS